MERVFDINNPGYSIKCKIYCEKIREVTSVVVFAHGFGGHKDNQAAARFAEALMAKVKHTAVLAYDMPCHGADIRKKLTMQDCYTYLEMVIAYIKEEMKVEKIYLYSVSFGGFTAFHYINHHGNPFTKAAFRCPAVKMYDAMASRILTDENKQLLQKGKDVLAGFDRKIRIDQAFLDEIEAIGNEEVDLIDYADDMLIIQGTSDEVVSWEASKEFADDNVIEFIAVEKADHRFKDLEKLNLAHSHIIDFFLPSMKGN